MGINNFVMDEVTQKIENEVMVLSIENPAIPAAHLLQASPHVIQNPSLSFEVAGNGKMVLVEPTSFGPMVYYSERIK